MMTDIWHNFPLQLLTVTPHPFSIIRLSRCHTIPST